MTNLEQLEQQLATIKNKKGKADSELKAAKDKKSELAKKERQIARKIKNELSAQKRKERTQRLIKMGGMVEKVAGGEVDLYKLEDYLNYYSRAIKGLKKTDIENSNNSIDI